MLGQPRQVGEFIGTNRPIIRTLKNPMDKCTIVSIYPKDIKDSKDTIQPSNYFIPAGSLEKPSITVVGAAAYVRDDDYEKPLIEVPVGSISVAESIVRDYIIGLLGVSIGDAQPGIFFVHGERDLVYILKSHKKDLDIANERQNRWYKVLVRLADSLWSRSNQNPLAIWDEMRMAAKHLGLDKPWMKDFQAFEMVQCFGCGNLRNPVYPVCPACKVVDQNHPLAKDLKFAQ